jgi:hypothetical protein
VEDERGMDRDIIPTFKTYLYVRKNTAKAIYRQGYDVICYDLRQCRAAIEFAFISSLLTSLQTFYDEQ